MYVNMRICTHACKHAYTSCYLPTPDAAFRACAHSFVSNAQRGSIHTCIHTCIHTQIPGGPQGILCVVHADTSSASGCNGSCNSPTRSSSSCICVCMCLRFCICVYVSTFLHMCVYVSNILHMCVCVYVPAHVRVCV